MNLRQIEGAYYILQQAKVGVRIPLRDLWYLDTDIEFLAKALTMPCTIGPGTNFTQAGKRTREDAQIARVGAAQAL